MGKRTTGPSQTLQPTDYRWMISKATESCDISGGQKEEKIDEDGGTLPVRKKKMTQMMFRRVFTFKKKIHTA